MELHEFKDRLPQHLHHSFKIECMYNTTNLRSYQSISSSSPSSSPSSLSSSLTPYTPDQPVGSSGEFLFVGTSDGHILKYAIVSRQNMLGDTEIDIQLLETYLHSRGKKIQKLMCDDELGLLFVMCQGQLDMMRHYDHRAAMEADESGRGDGNVKLSVSGAIRIKEASNLNTFCLDQKNANNYSTGGSRGRRSRRAGTRRTFAHRLCVSVRRRLVFIQYTPDSYKKLEEHAIPEPCHDIVFYGQSLMLGMKREYTIVRLDNRSSVLDTPSSGHAPAAAAAVISTPASAVSAAVSATVAAAAGAVLLGKSGKKRPDGKTTAADKGELADGKNSKQLTMLQSTHVNNVYTVLELERNMKPLAILMDNEVILRRNNLCVFVDMVSGMPTARNAIVWSNTPIDITVCFPYIVAQLPQDKLEVFNIYEIHPKLVETHAFRTGSGIGAVGGGASGVVAGSMLGINTFVKEALSDFKGDDGFQDRGSVFAGHTSNQNGIKHGIFLFQNQSNAPSIHLLQPIAFDKQVKALIDKCRCEEAFELFQKTFNINLATGQQHLNTMLKMKLQQMYEDSGYALLLNSDSDFELAKDAFERYFDNCTVQALDMRQLLEYFFDSRVTGSSGHDARDSSTATAFDHVSPYERRNDRLLSTIYMKNIRSKRSSSITPSSNLDAVNADIEKLAFGQFDKVKQLLLKPFLEHRRNSFVAQLKVLEDRQQREFQYGSMSSLTMGAETNGSGHLQQQRQSHAGTVFKLEEQLTLIDNALLRLYLETHVSKDGTDKTNISALGDPSGSSMDPLEILLRQNPLFCDLQESKRALLQAKNTAFYLALLLRAHGMIDESLQLLHDIGHGHNTAMGLSMGFREGDAQRASANTREQRKALEETISILSSITKQEHKHLIFKYAKWAILKSPDEAIQIFKRSSPDDSVLRPEEVLLFLAREFRDNSPAFQHDQSQRPHQQPEWLRRFTLLYIEHLLVDQGNKETQFHTQLAILYIDDILRWRRIQRSRASKMNAREHQQQTDPEIVTPLTGSYLELRTKLRIHLERSSFYHFETIAARLQKTGLFEERIIVYRKMGHHEEALKIILFDLRDLALAENYCLLTSNRAIPANLEAPVPTTLSSPFRMQRQERSKSLSTQDTSTASHHSTISSLINGDNFLSNPLRSKLFLIMLSLCFHPPTTRNVNSNTQRGKSLDMDKYRKFAIDVINIHATKINPLKLLTLVPDDIYTQDIALFLARSVRESEYHTKSVSVYKNLSRGANLQLEHELSCISRERRVSVGHNTRCGVCSKRIAPTQTRSIFPDNSVFHLSCIQGNNRVHPVTKRDFLIDPVDKLYYRQMRSSIDSSVIVTRVDPHALSKKK